VVDGQGGKVTVAGGICCWIKRRWYDEGYIAIEPLLYLCSSSRPINYAGLTNNTSAILHEGSKVVYSSGNTLFVVQRLTGTGRDLGYSVERTERLRVGGRE